MRDVPASLRAADAALEADTRAWGLPVSSRWWLIALPLVGAAIVAATSFVKPLYHFLIDEDQPIEWAQFVAILVAAVVFALAAREASLAGRRTIAVLFILVAVAAFIVAGEEISWGQRILGLETPGGLEDINHQGETNIHNIGAIQRLFNVAELVAGLYGFLMPILWLSRSVRQGLGGRLDRLLIPPLAFASFFFLPFAYRAFRALFLPEAGERITEYGEWPELTFYAGVLLTGLVIWRALRNGRLHSDDQA